MLFRLSDSKLKVEKQHDLGVLEEDDEFEEFPAEDWKQVNDGRPPSFSVIYF